MGQVVDTPTAQEFMREALEKITPEELDATAALCERKAAMFHEAIHGPPLDEAALPAGRAAPPGQRDLSRSRHPGGDARSVLGMGRLATRGDRGAAGCCGRREDRPGRGRVAQAVRARP